MKTQLEAFFQHFFTPVRTLVEEGSNRPASGVHHYVFLDNETEQNSVHTDLFPDVTYDDPDEVYELNNYTEVGDYGEHHSEFGVHITYDKLYNSILFLACIYVGGQIASRVLRMPDLVGEVVVGILLGPPLLDFVPNPPAWVLLGEIGLIILVLEAGIDIDVASLKLIGTRGMVIALFGSFLPIALGAFVAWVIGINDVKSIIAAGATFGPTSLGIALNILRGGGILNTPVGQLIISAAVIDDMIALIILSQLEALVGTITVSGVLIPVVSAMLFLFIGGGIAIWLIPPFVNKYILSRFNKQNHDKVELTIMLAIMLAMMPATYHSQASYLMGAFVAGLAFCTSHGLHAIFVRQFKRVLQWLMRIFFAASIGFQVPISDFASGKIIWQGLVFTIALLGKLAVGFMVPNFTQSRSFTNFHLRDCLITGFSMAAEGEFAFVIAVFAVDQGLIDKDTYASVVLAVLLSTIIPPFLLRFTISFYGKRSAQAIDAAAKTEMERKHNLDLAHGTGSTLVDDVVDETAVFFCIQTHSEAQWNLLFNLMATMSKQGLDIIDHRSWHPRGVNTAVINEIYCKDSLRFKNGNSDRVLEKRKDEIKKGLEHAIQQPGTAKVRVHRWCPGVVEEIIENVAGHRNVQNKRELVFTDAAISSRLLGEAKSNLERKDALIMNAGTGSKSAIEILDELSRERKVKHSSLDTMELGGTTKNEGARGNGQVTHKRSGGTNLRGGKAEDRTQSARDLFANPSGADRAAEIVVQGEVYKIRILDETKNFGTGAYDSSEMLDNHGVSVSLERDDVPLANRLQGYVRNGGTFGKVSENESDNSTTDNNSESS